jgi:cation diffusion facilitator family transporter
VIRCGSSGAGPFLNRLTRFFEDAIKPVPFPLTYFPFMHRSHTELQHEHVFQPPKKHAERKTAVVFYITILTMTVEIVAGRLSGSMALFADGCHMGTHAAALGIAFVAFAIARKYARDQRFAFGTWKVEILGAYTSAIVLAIVALSMVVMSIERFIHPERIAYDEAITVAIIGLVVNLVCAIVLSVGPPHSHSGHGHEAEHHHDHSSDLNLKAAFVHVVTDALTSVLAIGALLGARFFDLVFLDPLMGIVGALLIWRWTWGLLRDSSGILVDKEMDAPIAGDIRRILESDGTSRVSDLHVWRVAQDKYACIVTLARSGDATIADYKERLKELHDLIHVTIEPHRLESTPPRP